MLEVFLKCVLSHSLKIVFQEAGMTKLDIQSQNIFLKVIIYF